MNSGSNSSDDDLRIVLLAGGFGGARFTRALRDHVARAERAAHITVIANTGDDLWVHGLRVCPDLDTLMYTLGNGLDEERGWGRRDESFRAIEELRTYGIEPTWFGLGDRDIATHLVRSASLNAGFPLSAVTRALCERWQPGVELLPMSDDRAETHVVVATDNGHQAMHFQEWWVRHQAQIPAEEFVIVGIDQATPAPGVLESIANADLIVLPPSNPVVSIGTILAVPGIREALRDASAPIVGYSPIIGGAPLRGMADACLRAIGVETSARGVAEHYGARDSGGLLDRWYLDESDVAQISDLPALSTYAIPLRMSDPVRAEAMAATALDILDTA